MKCPMCEREVKEEVSEDGFQVDYICPIHRHVGGSISSIGYREQKTLDAIKAIATILCLVSFYLNFIHSSEYDIDLPGGWQDSDGIWHYSLKETKKRAGQ